MSKANVRDRLRRWQFWLPLALQLALILLIPLQASWIQTTGERVVLQTAPVDPYDLFRGYYVTLSYDISRPQTLSELDGWDTFTAEQATRRGEFGPLPRQVPFYVTLEAPAEAQSQLPLPWQPVAISGDRPAQLSPDQVALKGTVNPAFISDTGGPWLYGLERYYIPEAQRQEINDRIQAAQSVQPGEAGDFLVEISVNRRGEAVPIKMWIQGQVYRF